MNATQLAKSPRQGSQAILPEDISLENVLAFCRDVNLEFFASGRPEDWDDATVFRAGTIEYPKRGNTISYDRVREWRVAVVDMGDRIPSGGVYAGRDGQLCKTICEARDHQGNGVVVYLAPDGEVKSCPTGHFFGFMVENGVLVARHSLVERIPAADILDEAAREPEAAPSVGV